MIMEDSKSQKYLIVSKAILEIIENEGPNHLTHSQVSRRSHVSRAWIYEYMGKKRSDLIEIASDTFSNYFTFKSLKKDIKTKKELINHLRDSQDEAFLKIMSTPVIIKLYFRFKGTPTPMGISIEKYEKSWLDNIADNLVQSLKYSQEKSLTSANTILTLRLGLYHRVVTSKEPSIELLEAKKILELFYHGL